MGDETTCAKRIVVWFCQCSSVWYLECQGYRRVFPVFLVAAVISMTEDFWVVKEEVLGQGGSLLVKQS